MVWEFLNRKNPYHILYSVKVKSGGSMQGSEIHHELNSLREKAEEFDAFKLEHLQTVAALKESQRLLKTLIGNLPGMAYRCKNDKDWTMEFISEGCEIVTGYSHEALEGNKKISYGDLIVEEDREYVYDTIQEAISENKPFKMEYRIKKSTGEIRWVWEQGVGVFNNEEELVALEGFISDITNEKRAYDEIEKQRDFNTSLVSNTPAFIATINRNGTVNSMNKALLSALDYSSEEVIGTNFADKFIPPEEKKHLLNLLMETRHFETPIHTENHLLTRDGKQLLVEWYEKPIYDKDGIIDKFFFYGMDITETRHSEEKIEYHKNLEEAISKASQELVKYDADLNKVLELVCSSSNIGLSLLFELEENDNRVRIAEEYSEYEHNLIKKGEAIFSTSDFASMISQLIQGNNIVINETERGELLATEREFVEKHGIKSFVIIPLVSVEKQLFGFTLFATISEHRAWEQYEISIFKLISQMITNYFRRKNYEEELIKSKEKAENSVKMKNEFLAQMSHEVRTPINVIMSFSSLLRDKIMEATNDEESEMALRSIKNATKRITRTIELLLNMAEMQSGTYEYSPKQIDIYNEVLIPLLLNSRHWRNKKE